MTLLRLAWDCIRIVYAIGFVVMFSFIIYANSPLPIFSDFTGCCYAFLLALLCSALWPLVLYAIYMLTTHH